jgi:hypothetical protein
MAGPFGIEVKGKVDISQFDLLKKQAPEIERVFGQAFSSLKRQSGELNAAISETLSKLKATSGWRGGPSGSAGGVPPLAATQGAQVAAEATARAKQDADATRRVMLGLVPGAPLPPEGASVRGGFAGRYTPPPTAAENAAYQARQAAAHPDQQQIGESWAAFIARTAASQGVTMTPTGFAQAGIVPPDGPPGGGIGGAMASAASAAGAAGMGFLRGFSGLALGAGAGYLGAMAANRVLRGIESGPAALDLFRLGGSKEEWRDTSRDPLKEALDKVYSVPMVAPAQAFHSAIEFVSRGGAGPKGIRELSPAMREAASLGVGLGLGPEVTSGLFGAASRHGRLDLDQPGKAEQQMRHFALLIGESVASTGLRGLQGEIVQGVDALVNISSRTMLQPIGPERALGILTQLGQGSPFLGGTMGLDTFATAHERMIAGTKSMLPNIDDMLGGFVLTAMRRGGMNTKEMMRAGPQGIFGMNPHTNTAIITDTIRLMDRMNVQDELQAGMLGVFPDKYPAFKAGMLSVPMQHLTPDFRKELIEMMKTAPKSRYGELAKLWSEAIQPAELLPGGGYRVSGFRKGWDQESLEKESRKIFSRPDIPEEHQVKKDAELQVKLDKAAREFTEARAKLTGALVTLTELFTSLGEGLSNMMKKLGVSEGASDAGGQLGAIATGAVLLYGGWKALRYGTPWLMKKGWHKLVSPAAGTAGAAAGAAVRGGGLISRLARLAGAFGVAGPVIGALGDMGSEDRGLFMYRNAMTAWEAGGRVGPPPNPEEFRRAAEDDSAEEEHGGSGSDGPSLPFGSLFYPDWLRNWGSGGSGSEVYGPPSPTDSARRGGGSGSEVYGPPSPTDSARRGGGLGGLRVPPRFQVMIAEEAARAGLPLDLARATLMSESSGDPNAKGDKGERGLMQLMPSHWVPGQDPTDPRWNVRTGFTLLASHLQNRGGDMRAALYDYKRGPNAKGEPPPGTVALVDKVFKLMEQDRLVGPGVEAGIGGMIDWRAFADAMRQQIQVSIAPLTVIHRDESGAVIQTDQVQPRLESAYPFAGPSRSENDMP